MKTRLLRLSAGVTPLPKPARFVIATVLLSLWACCPDAHAGGVVGWANGQGSHCSGISPGVVIAELPAGFVQVSAGDTGYYYYNGVYFRPVASLSSGYEVVAPPVGAIVPQLPTAAELVTVVDNAYYYAGGAFYVQQPTGFAVVPAPQGAVVNAPPLGAMPVTVNGAFYYQADNAYYQPVVIGGGVTLYTTVSL